MKYDEAVKIIASLKSDNKKHEESIKNNLERIQELSLIEEEEFQFDIYIPKLDEYYCYVDIGQNEVLQEHFCNEPFDQNMIDYQGVRRTKKAAQNDLDLLILTTKFKRCMQLWSGDAEREYTLIGLDNNTFSMRYNPTTPYWLRGNEEAIQRALKVFSNGELKAIFTQTWVSEDD